MALFHKPIRLHAFVPIDGWTYHRRVPVHAILTTPVKVYQNDPGAIFRLEDVVGTEISEYVVIFM
jgi:hypothetical protein